MIRRLLWALPHPTPYNIYLLNELNERLDLPSEALYSHRVLESHPWSALPPMRFGSDYAPEPGGRSPLLEQRSRSEADTLVVFAGWRDTTIRPALWARWRRRLPYAFWTDTPKIGRNPLRLLLNRAFVFFARDAVVTLATGSVGVERYVDMGVPADRLENFPFVVDPVHFHASRDEEECSGTTRFFLPARLIDDLKGQSVALRALSIVRAEHPDANLELVLAGVGPDRGKLQERARDLKVDDRVRFAGWVEYEALPRELSRVDALVLPSWWDPFPVAVIEAMAAGLPVLGSRACGSVRERIEDGANGFIHEPGDAEALASHMLRIHGDMELRRSMREAALRTSREWGIERCSAAVERVLARVGTPAE